MAIVRPRHLRARPTNNRIWGEDAVLIQEAAGRRDGDGNWIPGRATRVAVRCAVMPLAVGQAIDLAAGDVARLSEMRQFAMTLPSGARAIAPIRTTEGSRGDQIEWNNRLFRVVSVAVWGNDYYVAIGSREDPQPASSRPPPPEPEGRFGGRFAGRFG